MTRKEKYRRILLVLAALFLVVGIVAGYASLRDKIPDELHVDQKSEEPLKSLQEHPLLTFSKETKEKEQDGSYLVECSVAGMVPLKQVKVTPEVREKVYVCGAPVGIYMETSGVMVVCAAELEDETGFLFQPAGAVLKPGDYILAVNGEKITGKQQLTELVKESGGNAMKLEIQREQEKFSVQVNPVRTKEGGYRIGVWVRDNLQGIGTMTYVEKNGNFAALGHGISDLDTGKLLKLERGDLYRTEILSVVQGREGDPGELQGVIHYEDRNKVGRITENTVFGIRGTLNQNGMQQFLGEEVEIAYWQEIEKGPAKVLMCTGKEIKAYDAQITEIHAAEQNSNKNFVIQMTDPELMKKTGGIVQGNSGSPVLQKGRLVGAVTHVFVNEPEKGYGIFIENMMRHKK